MIILSAYVYTLRAVLWGRDCYFIHEAGTLCAFFFALLFVYSGLVGWCQVDKVWASWAFIAQQADETMLRSAGRSICTAFLSDVWH